jgi:hypothetical protein
MQLVDIIKLDPIIVDGAIRLFLVAKRSSDKDFIQRYPANSVQGMWLFCSLLLIVKTLSDGIPTELRALLQFKMNNYEHYSMHWAGMELHYLRLINYTLYEFIQSKEYRISHLPLQTGSVTLQV